MEGLGTIFGLLSTCFDNLKNYIKNEISDIKNYNRSDIELILTEINDLKEQYKELSKRIKTEETQK